MADALQIIVSWIDKQFGDRLTIGEQIALCDRMARQYHEDPEHYGRVSLWKLNDDVTTKYASI